MAIDLFLNFNKMHCDLWLWNVPKYPKNDEINIAQLSNLYHDADVREPNQFWNEGTKRLRE